MANAQLAEVQALTAYGLAKVQLDQSVGNVLASNRIEIGRAKSGMVSRPPSPVPTGAARKVRLCHSGLEWLRDEAAKS